MILSTDRVAPLDEFLSAKVNRKTKFTNTFLTNYKAMSYFFKEITINNILLLFVK
jgi:hypothetical protein